MDNLNALEVGTIAPIITLNHKKYKNTTDLKGNLIYVIFWATWNAESLQELKLMQKINTKIGCLRLGEFLEIFFLKEYCSLKVVIQSIIGITYHFFE